MNFIKNKVLLHSLIISTFFFLANFILLQYGHFHEDAYILFIYVENMLNGNGITYYPSGAHTEGATDFLWMILLFLLAKIGFDVGTASILLNSFGVLLITTIILHEVSSIKKETIYKKIAYLFLPLAWIGQSYLIAAAGGFSVFFYISIVALTTYLLYKEAYLLWVPILSIILGLIRPDGVILGIGFVFIGLFLANKKTITKKYIIVALFAALIGASYFVWRYLYFGNLLPLPLYVKGSDDILSGANKNLNWLKKYGGGLHFIIIMSLSVYLKNTKKILFLLLPSLLLFIALATATQSQNIGYRFQAPIFIMLYLTTVFLLVNFIDRFRFEGNKKLDLFLVLIIPLGALFLINNSLTTGKKIQHLSEFNYINEFPLQLKNILDEHLDKELTLVLTEAGRLAYWNQRNNIKIFDLVGLNTAYPAKNDIDTSYIKSLNPSIIMYEHATFIDSKRLKSNENLIVLENNNILERSITFDKKASKVSLAAEVATNYLHNNFDEYDVILVDFVENKKFSHVYAIKKDLYITKHIVFSINDIFTKRQNKSYYKMKELNSRADS